MTVTQSRAGSEVTAADDPDREPSPGLVSRLRRAGRGAVQQVSPWQYGSLLATKVFLALMVAGVLAGPAALVWTIAAHQQTPAAVAALAPTGGEDGRSRTQVIAAASNLVSVWLSAGQAEEETVSSLVADPPAQLALPRQRPAPPTTVTVIDAVQTSEMIWEVTVAARGGQAGAGAAYRVPVALSERGASPLTLPGQVSTPTSPRTTFAAELRPVPSTHPAAQTVNGFARALLSNSGDLSRWLVPGSALTPVTPRACQQIRAAVSAPTSLTVVPRNGETAWVVTDLTCRNSASSAHTFQYTLSLRGRDGRWEVDSYTNPTAPPLSSGASSAPGPTFTEPTPR